MYNNANENNYNWWCVIIEIILHSTLCKIMMKYIWKVIHMNKHTCMLSQLYIRRHTCIQVKFSYISIKTNATNTHKSSNYIALCTTTLKVPIQTLKYLYISSHTTWTRLHQASPNQSMQHLHDRNTASNDSIAFSPLP